MESLMLFLELIKDELQPMARKEPNKKDREV